MPELKKQYELLSKKYKLPDFVTMVNEFEIETIETEVLLLKHIRIKMCDKLEHFSKMLEQLIQADSNLAAMNEINYIDDLHKNLIYGLYRQFMQAIRSTIKLDINYSEDAETEAIKTILKLWQESKEELLKVAILLENSWKKDKEVKENLGYVG